MKNNIEVGDVVCCISDFGFGGDDVPRKGEVFLVTSVDNRWIGFKLDRLKDYPIDIVNGSKANWGAKYFIKIGNSKIAKILLKNKRL